MRRPTICRCNWAVRTSTRPGIRAMPSLGYMVMTPPSYRRARKARPRSKRRRRRRRSPRSRRRMRQRRSRVRWRRASAASPKRRPPRPPIVPQGGFFWDGRADTLEEQSIGPMLSPFEMDNAERRRRSIRSLARAPYRRNSRVCSGRRCLGDEKRLLSEATFALARYEFEEPSFHPFTSKFDYYLRGEAALSEAETRGLNIVRRPEKGRLRGLPSRQGRQGRCSSPSSPTISTKRSPRRAIPRSRPTPTRTSSTSASAARCAADDYAKQPDNCGLFKTPTLAQRRHARGVLPQRRLPQP